MFDKKLLDVLACPVCKGKLTLVEDKQQLICRFDRLSFPIKNGIPVLIEKEATTITLDELEATR